MKHEKYSTDNYPEEIKKKDNFKMLKSGYHYSYTDTDYMYMLTKWGDRGKRTLYVSKTCSA